MDLFGVRRSDSGVLAGVCAGLARRWQVDVTLVRVGAVVLALSAGVGVVLYLFGWLLLPTESDDRTVLDRHAPRLARQSREFWLIALVVCCVAMATTVGSMAPLGVLPLVVLVAVWYFGFRRPGREQQRQPSDDRDVPASLDPFAGPPTPFTTAAREWQQTVLQAMDAPLSARPTGSSSDPSPATPPVPAPQLVPQPTAAVKEFLNDPDPLGLYRAEPAPTAVATVDRRPARRSLLVTALVTTLTLGTLGIVDAALPSLALAPAVYLGAALAVLALSLLAATWTGRWFGQRLIAIAVAIAAVVTLGGASLDRTGWSTPQQVVQVATADLPGEQTFEAGSILVDLSGVENLTTDQTYRITGDVGRVEVVLPAGVRSEVRASTDVGRIRLQDGSASGGVDISASSSSGPDSGAVLHVEIVLDGGEVLVR